MALSNLMVSVGYRESTRKRHMEGEREEGSEREGVRRQDELPSE